MGAKYGLQILNEGGRIVQGTPAFFVVELLDLTQATVSDAPSGNTWIPVAGATMTGTLTPPSGDVSQQVSFTPWTLAGQYAAQVQIPVTGQVGVWFLSMQMVKGTEFQQFPKRPIFRVVSI